MRRRGVHAGCCHCGAAPPDGALYTARNTIRGELCLNDMVVGGPTRKVFISVGTESACGRGLDSGGGAWRRGSGCVFSVGYGTCWEIHCLV